MMSPIRTFYRALPILYQLKSDMAKEQQTNKSQSLPTMPRSLPRTVSVPERGQTLALL